MTLALKVVEAGKGGTLGRAEAWGEQVILVGVAAGSQTGAVEMRWAVRMVRAVQIHSLGTFRTVSGSRIFQSRR